jgi:phosphatidylglycerophosphatase A|tara:strand:- start:14 stop:517 length:504 start_codon:yes stop_codon:yes gene_type:complete
MIKTFNSLLVTMFGLGKIKFMPGTFGSLATTIILFYLFHTLNISSYIILIGLIIIFIYSFYAVSTYTKDNKSKDPEEIVIDEFLGQSIPIYLYEISHGTTKESNEAIVYYSLFFILFRYFDIMKPFPVNFFDKTFKNSFGVIMDDICAGIYVVLTVVCFMMIKSLVL